MGNDYGCICSKDTGDIPVPSSDYKFESPRVIENSPMKQSIQKSQSRNINMSSREQLSSLQMDSRFSNLTEVDLPL